ncbi:MAG TPA: DUF3382 domain-containing protein, partial [Alphaproteobacteria bacterium]|nr:DUF3382 domain-containing protein [Alphaproteobacteria bacterium]
MRRLKDAFITALIAGLLALPLAAPRTVDGLNGLAVEWHVVDVGVACALIFLGRLALGLIEDGFGSYIAPLALIAGIASAYLPMPSHFLKTVAVAGSFVIALRAIFGLTIKRRHPGESRDPEGIAASASRLKLLWSI